MAREGGDAACGVYSEQQTVNTRQDSSLVEPWLGQPWKPDIHMRRGAWTIFQVHSTFKLHHGQRCSLLPIATTYLTSRVAAHCRGLHPARQLPSFHPKICPFVLPPTAPTATHDFDNHVLPL
jgi:hypothetical protein